MRAPTATLARLACLSLLAAGCQSSPPPAERATTPPSEPAARFDPARAWRHMELLTRVGPRPMGSRGVEKARAYIRSELEALDLEIQEQRLDVEVPDREKFEIVNLAGRIPGESDDAVVLVTHYDSRRAAGFEFLGANESASGVAVLLEMARALSDVKLPYTTWFVFLDGDGPLEPSGEPAHIGARALVSRLAEEGALEQIRLALLIEQVCDPDLRIARDLGSNRVYREVVWQTAGRLGHGEVFPADAAYENVAASHRAFGLSGLRRVVAIVDTRFGGDEPPGVYAGTADDDLEHCSADSLGVVGPVALEALDVITRRLAKIDRFAASPVGEAQALAWDALAKQEAEEEQAAGQAAAEGAAASTEAPPPAAEPAPSIPTESAPPVGAGEGAAPGEPDDAAQGADDEAAP